MAGTLDNKREAWKPFRMVIEAVTFLLLIAPVFWLATRWPWIPAISPYLRHTRVHLWILPTYAIFVYVAFSEAGLLSRMGILRPGQRLARLRPLFLNYILVARMELMFLIAGLSLGLDWEATTGLRWSAKGFITASMVVIGATVLLFIFWGARSAYRFISLNPRDQA